MTLRLGIIGLGQAGSHTVMKAVKHTHIEIAAAADLNEQTLEAFKRDFPEAETYRDAAELVRSERVDAVYIATPTGMHMEHVIQAAENKKHVLVEKPIARTLQEADAMIEIARQHGVVFMVNHKRSYDPPIAKMREIIESGELGRVRMMHSWHFSDWLYRPRTAEELSDGGVVLRQGAHHFDIARYLGGGEVRSVKGSIGVWDPQRPAEGSYTAYLEFEDGTVATSVYSGYDHFQFTELTDGIGVEGKKRNSWFTDKDVYASARKKLLSIAHPDGERALKKSSGYGSARQKEAKDAGSLYSPHFGLTIVSCERGDMMQSPSGVIVYGDLEKREIAVTTAHSGLDAIIAEFYDAIVHGKKPVHDGDYGKACLEICLGVLESARERKEIPLRFQPAI